jgi:uncharacterized protein
MVRRWIGLAILALMMICLLGLPVYAAGGARVADLAGLLTEDEEARLAAAAQSLGERYQMDIVIVTASDTGGLSSEAYADDYFDYNGYGIGEARDGILFLINMSIREIWISTSGRAIHALTDARIDGILDDVYNSGLADGEYYQAAQAFLSSTDNVLAGNRLTWPEGLAGAAVSGLAGLWFFAGTRNAYKGRRQNSIFDYHRNSLVNLGVVADDLTNSFVTSRALPRNPPSGSSFGGGSSTHTSSSGRTHGGGGRRF